MRTYKGFEVTIGLEVHVELKTEHKLFCGCRNEFGRGINTNTCPVCLGMPGTLPVLNGEAVKLSAQAGVILNCRINRRSVFDRKQYFYPDLPKGYQITQFYDPLCEDGYIDIDTDSGKKRIGIERIHIEEDAGKLVYDGDSVMPDYNRCGAPLIEIVTRPDMADSSEAAEFIRMLRLSLLYAGISDCRMNEGSLRCDANVSVKKEGAAVPGTRCEIKNINSVRYLAKAIDSEFIRQTELILSGGTVECQTRRFSEDTGATQFMRVKETVSDYRYIREPDIPAVITDGSYVERAKSGIKLTYPEAVSYMEKHGISPENTKIICSEPSHYIYMKEVMDGRDPDNDVIYSNLFISEIIPMMKRDGHAPSSDWFRDSADLYCSGRISIVSARKLIAEETPGVDAGELAVSRNMIMITDEDQLTDLVREADGIRKEASAEIRNGKTGAVNTIIGEVMRMTRGRADPKKLTEIARRFYGITG